MQKFQVQSEGFTWTNIEINKNFKCVTNHRLLSNSSWLIATKEVQWQKQC